MTVFRKEPVLTAARDVKSVFLLIKRFARPYENIGEKRDGEPAANILISCRKRRPSGPTIAIIYQWLMEWFATRQN